MNRNIDIGTFQFDSNKIEDKIAANTLEMGKFAAMIKSAKEQVKDQSKNIADLEKKIESERKAQERLNKYLDEGTISQEKYNQEIEKSNANIDQLIDEQIQASKAQADAVIVQNKLQQSTKELGLENNELNKLLAAGRSELNDNEGAYRNLNKELNALKTEAKNLGAQMVVLEMAGKKDSDEYKALAARFSEVSQEAEKLNDSFKKIDSAVGDNQRSVGAYKEAITDAFSELTIGLKKIISGDIIGGLDSIKKGFDGIKSAAMEAYAYLLANPITALFVGIAAVVTGIGLAVKEIFKYNESIKENINLVENLTGVTGKAADEIRNRASGLAKTFGDEFNDVVKTANVLAKQLGISYDEAFKQIENGYVRGANANGDFLERLKEYGPLLSKYGFDINEIIGLQVQAQQQGIFNDKFEDSLKEAGLSLEEFTKAQADALTSAFGQGFSDKINKGVNSGALSVKDALLLIGNEAKKRGLSVQEFGIITADVFKGAGEDAGGAQKMFENLYAGLQKAEEPLTELQKKTLALSDANYQLAKAKDEALKSDTVLNLISDFEILQIKVETVFYKIIGWLRDAATWFDEITGISETLGQTWDVVVDYASSLWKMVENLVDVFSSLFNALGLNNDETKSFTKSIFNAINPINLIKSAFILLTGIIQSFSKFISDSKVNITAFALTVKSIFSQIVSAAKSFIDLDFEGGLNKLKNINISKEFAAARKEAERIAALNKQETSSAEKISPQKNLTNGKTQAEKDAEAKAAADAAKKAEAEAKKAENKRIADAKKAADEAEKALKEEAKRQLDIAREAANQQSEIAKSELAEYIAINAEKYKNDKTLHQKKLQDQLAYYDEVKRLQTQANNAEEAAKQFAIDQKIQELEAKKNLNANDLNEIKNLNLEKQNISKEYYVKEIELTKDTEEKKKDIQKEYDLQVTEQKKLRQALQFQQQLLDLESQKNKEIEIEKLKEEERFQQELADWAERNKIKLDLDENDYISKQEIQNARKELENQIALEDDANEKIRLQNKLNDLNNIEQESANKRKQIEQSVQDAKLSAYSTVFGSIKTLVGEGTAVGKAAAIAETTINTYKAATAAYAAGASLGGPLGAIMGPVLAGLAVASGLANLKKIASVQPKGYAKGGLITGGVEISRSNGDNRLITAKDGEVILNEDQQKALGGASVFKMLGIPGFATGGVVGAPASSLSTVQSTIRTNQPTIVLDDAAVAQIAGATYSGSQSGIGDLSENRKIANGANF